MHRRLRAPPAREQGDDSAAPSDEQWFPPPASLLPPPSSPGPSYPSYPGARPHREDHAFYSIEAGYLYENLYSVPINSVDITGILGKTIGNFGVGAIVQGSPGENGGGLDTFTFSAGVLFEGHIDRFRLGGGVNLGIFNAQRITTSDSLTTGTVGGLGVRGTVDLVQFGPDGALFIVGKAELRERGRSTAGSHGGGSACGIDRALPPDEASRPLAG